MGVSAVSGSMVVVRLGEEGPRNVCEMGGCRKMVCIVDAVEWQTCGNRGPSDSFRLSPRSTPLRFKLLASNGIERHLLSEIIAF